MVLKENCTTEELATILGISNRKTSDLARRNILKKESRDNYLVFDSIQSYCEHLRQVAAGRGGEGAQLNLTAERARLAKEQADREEMKNNLTRGEILKADDVEREWADILKNIRSAVLALPNRIAERITTLTTTDISIIDREARDLLEDLANNNTTENTPCSFVDTEATTTPET